MNIDLITDNIMFVLMNFKGRSSIEVHIGVARMGTLKVFVYTVWSESCSLT